MKIKINSFMELDNVTLSTPAKISGKNGIGKTTIFRAFCFAMNMNDPQTDKTFDGRIYRQKNSKITESYKVSVELDFGSVILRREAAPKIRYNGDDYDITRSVTSKYYINDVPKNQSDYTEKLNELTANIKADYLCDYKSLRRLTIAESKQLFAEIFGLAEFNSEKLELAKVRVSKAKEEIIRKKAALEDAEANYSKLDRAPDCSDDILKEKSRLAILQNKRNEQQPTLTAAQIAKNKEIKDAIIEIENRIFEKPHKEFPIEPLHDLSHLRDAKRQAADEITNLHLNVFTFADDKKIALIEEQLKKVDELKDELNHPQAFEGTHCPTCGTKRSGLSHAEIENQLEILDENMLLSELGKLELAKKEAAAKFEEAKKERLNVLEAAFQNLEKRILDTEKENAEIADRNAEAAAHNFEIAEKNNAAKEADERKRKAVIAKLTNDYEKPKAFDFSEIDAEIENVKNTIEVLEVEQKKRTEYDAQKNLLEKMISENSLLISKLQKELFEAEKNLLDEKSRKVEFYETAERELNEILPEGVSVKLFKKNISNDDISDTFEISYNNSPYNSGAYEILNITRLIKSFQDKLNVNLPIFIDEFANVVNEDIINQLPENSVIILPKENQNLTIK